MQSALPLPLATTNIAQLAAQSLWLSRHEITLLLSETDSFPPYLKELACGALQAEDRFRKQLATEDPEQLQYLIDLKAWFARDDRTAANFPGWRGCWEETQKLPATSPSQLASPQTPAVDHISTHELERVENHSDAPDFAPDMTPPPAREIEEELELDAQASSVAVAPIPTWQPSVWQMPVDSSLLRLISVHPLSEFDELNFLRLLSGSFSLSVAEKKRIIDTVSTFSQFQIDELTKIFVEERQIFLKLSAEHEEDVRHLDEKRKKEMAFLQTLCVLETTSSDFVDDAILTAYLEVDTALLRFEFEQADELAQAAFDSCNFFSYEQCLKTHKALGELESEWLQTLIQHAANSLVPGLVDAVRVLIEFEQTGVDGVEQLWQRLQAFRLDGSLTWVPHYLLSRFHVYMDTGDNAFSMAQDQISLAFGLVAEDANIAKALMLFHFKRCLLLQGGDKTAAFMETNWESKFGGLGQYLSEIGWLVGDHRIEYDDDEALIDYLRRHINNEGIDIDLGLPDASETPSTRGRSLQKHLDAFGQALGDMGINWISTQHKDIDIALAEDRLSDAESLLSAAYLQAGANSQQQTLLWHKQVSLWRRQGKLNHEIASLQNAYATTPSAWHAWRLLTALYEVGAEGRTATLQLARTLVQRFYYLPAFQNILFATHHFLHTKSTHLPEAKQALWRAVVIGPALGVFHSMSGYYRWKKDNSNALDQYIALLAGILAGKLDRGEWNSAILNAFRAGWHRLGFALFLLAGHEAGYDSEIYNGLAIGVFDGDDRNLDRTLFALAANTQALNRHPELNAVCISNSASDLANLPDTVASNWQLYRAALAISLSPQHVWQQYNSLLNAARQLQRPDLYLPAYYVGLELGAEIDPWRENTHHMLAPLFCDGQMTLPDSRDMGYLSFLAYALSQESKWLGEHCHVAAPWHWIYELLRNIETLQANDHASSALGFLGNEAQRRYRELCLRAEWLLLRWPQQTCTERQQHRATELARLAQDFPQGEYQDSLNQDAADNQRRHLYCALSGGRIAHNHQTTVTRALPDWYKVVANHELAQLAARSQEKQILTLAEGHRTELLRQLVLDHKSALELFPNEIRQQIIRDWHLAVGACKNQAQLLTSLAQIAKNYAHSGDLAGDLPLSAPSINFITAIEQTYPLIDAVQQALQQDYARHSHAAFALVLKHHALAGSEMFESFRTRIRHGWLISSLKDCFARFDLYNEGNNDAILTPGMEQVVGQLNVEQRQGLEQALSSLRSEFRRIVSQLDKEWLWLKDDQHPQGLLDFDINNFDTLAPFTHTHLLTSNPDVLIDAICRIIDDHANTRFAHIREHLRQNLFAPLNSQLDDIAAWLQLTRAAILALPNGAHDYARLYGELNDARKEFAHRMDDYCSWFDFQEHGVRDFTLSEIAHMAWEVVTQIDGNRLRNAHIAPPAWHETLPDFWLPGDNFSDLLEVFKILLQNIVYHARPADLSAELPIDIMVTLYQRPDGRLSCKIASTCYQPERIDIAALHDMLADPARRHTRMQGKQGSGLATTQEILQHRLHGMIGELIGPRVEPATDGSKQFVVEMALQVSIPGEKPQLELNRQVSPDIAAIMQSVATDKVRVLVAEDQPPKYVALREFIRKLIPDCGILLADNLETAARLLSAKESHFDLLLLDMTLPEDPLPDAPLKSLAGLDVLKLMQIHNIPTPTVLVTQYSNWGDEATQNTRQFIETLSHSCARDFPKQFRGAVRFSHTDLAWQAELQALIQTTFNPVAHQLLDADSVEKLLLQDPNDRRARAWQAHHWIETGKCREALATLLRLLQDDANDPALLADLACAHAGLGQQDEAEQAIKTYQDLGGSDANTVKAQMLEGQMQWLQGEQQRRRQDEMMASLGQIAGGMAHELFSPMAAIQTQVDFARRYLLKGAPEEPALRDALNEIERQKVRMAEIVAHLRSLARGDKMSLEPVDLGQVVRNALALQQSQMNAHDIAVKLDIPLHLPHVLTNPLVMEQVFINLLLNARESLDTSKIEDKTIHVTIKLLAKNQHECLQVCVTDNGPGIPETLRGRIFEPFFTTKDIGHGLGLGLSLAHKAVSEYGGNIYLESPPAGGASFVVELPVMEERTS
ncbi:MAG: ATP-binding protein [Sulfuricellaceae bacterium]